MKKLIPLLFVTLFLLPIRAYAAAIGETWHDLDQVSKQLIVFSYKEGLKDGIAVARSYYYPEIVQDTILETHQHLVDYKTYKNVLLSRKNTTEIVGELDKFYSQRSNDIIPLDYAILYATQKLDGVSEEEAQKDLQAYRKELAATEIQHK